MFPDVSVLYGKQSHHVTRNCPRGCVQGFYGKDCTEGKIYLLMEILKELIKKVNC